MCSISNAPVTCEVRYRIDPSKIDDFKVYAQTWIRLIERHGGTHHGYFVPRESPVRAGVSFPNVGVDGANDIAVAMFTFPNDQAYRAYRKEVAKDPDGVEANARYGKEPPFHSYERLFLQPLLLTD